MLSGASPVVLDLCKSHATEFFNEGDTLIPPFLYYDGLCDNVARQLVRAREEGEFLSKTEPANVAASVHPS